MNLRLRPGRNGVDATGEMGHTLTGGDVGGGFRTGSRSLLDTHGSIEVCAFRCLCCGQSRHWHCAVWCR